MTPEERATAPPDHTHKWTIFLTSATSPPPARTAASSAEPPPIDKDYLPGGADDLSYLIKRVTFKLHDTYTPSSRAIDHPPFQVTETGWGEFVVGIRVQFVPESGEKPLNFGHPIKLHHWGEPIEGPPPVIKTVTEGETPSGSVPPATSEANGEKEDNDVKMETSTPAAEVRPDPSSPPIPESTPVAAESTEPNDRQPTQPEEKKEVESDNIVVDSGPPQPVSIASTLPVHSWQYDELVFSDPFQSFLTILNNNPPTPLPARNRRARNQREEHNARKKAKNKSSTTTSAVAGPSRGATVEPDTAAPNTPAATGGIVSSTPGPSNQTAGNPPERPVGIPGEPGSADVPLEFSAEMEKGEWNFLNDVRVYLVGEMDRWREKLIGEEKELAKLKEEMRL